MASPTDFLLCLWLCTIVSLWRHKKRGGVKWVKIRILLDKKKGDPKNQFVGVSLARKNVSTENISLYARKNSNHRLLFRLEQNNHVVFESRPVFRFHAAQPFKDPEFSTIELKPGEVFVDEILFSSIEGELINSSANYSTPFNLYVSFEYKYLRPGENASPRDSESLRTAEIIERNMSSPNSINYKSILISRAPQWSCCQTWWEV